MSVVLRSVNEVLFNSRLVNICSVVFSAKPTEYVGLDLND